MLERSSLAELLTFDSNPFFRLKKIEQEMDAEEAGRGQVTGELRMKKTQHMTTSRWGERENNDINDLRSKSIQEICGGDDRIQPDSS